MGIFCGTACRLAGREILSQKAVYRRSARWWETCQGFPIRNYHSNENVRLLAQYLGARPHFLYLPALPESLDEKRDIVFHRIVSSESAKCGNRWIRRWLISAIILPRRILLLWPAMGTAFRNNAPAYVCWRIIIMRTEV